MTKKNLMPVIVLTVICVIVAALLGGVNELTKGKIAENALKKEQAALIEVLPGSTLFDPVDVSGAEGLPTTVKSVYKEVGDKGYVLIMATSSQYSTEDMTFAIGITPDGSIAGIKLTNYKESKDFGKTTYPEKFVGKTEADYDDVDVTAGVTVSSKAFKAAIGDALEAIKVISQGSAPAAALGRAATLLSSSKSTDLPKTDDELSALISELLSGKQYTEAEIPSGAPEALKKLYSVSNNSGYVAYIVVPGAYVPVATEALVYINGSGDIEKVNLLSWIVGHGVGAGDFADRFEGKDIWHMNEVELVTGATGTSKDFYTAVDSVLDVITDILDKRETGFNELISEMISGKQYTEAEIPSGAPEALKKLYSVSNNSGYVAYIVVPGAYVPVATEALVYINGSGDIEKVNLLSWIVGHGVGAGDFADRFEGKDIWHMNEVELVTGATGTSNDFYTAVDSVLNIITDILGKRESGFLELVDEMIPNSGKITKAELPSDAPSTLVAVYKDSTGKGSVAHIVVPGAYVPVASEALVYFDRWGEIKSVKLLQWVVGHGIGPGDFAERFVGKSADSIEEVELVAGCTGTSGDLKKAITDACPYVPVDFPVLRIVGIVILVVSIGAFVWVSVSEKKRRTVG